MTFAAIQLPHPLWLVAQNRAHPKKNKATVPPPAPPLPEPIPTASKPSEIEAITGTHLFYKSKLHASLGWGSLRGNGSGFMVGAQLGYPLAKGSPIYIGPEVDFVLLSPGSLCNVLGTGWYEIHFDEGSPWSMALGLGAGAGFPQAAPALSKTSFAAYLDTVVSREIDDLASVRGQIRPGMVGGNLSLFVNIGVEFRFL